MNLSGQETSRIRLGEQNRSRAAGPADWLDQIEWLEQPPYFGVAGVDNIYVGTMLVFDLERSLSVLDRDSKSAVQLAEEHGQKKIARILRRHLEAIVRNQTLEIEKGGDGAAKHRRLRGLAWQALGEQEKAAADLAN